MGIWGHVEQRHAVLDHGRQREVHLLRVECVQMEQQPVKMHYYNRSEVTMLSRSNL